MKNKHRKDKHDIYTLDWIPEKQKGDNQAAAVRISCINSVVKSLFVTSAEIPDENAKGKYGIYTLDWLPKRRKKDNQEAVKTDRARESFWGEWEDSDGLLYVFILLAFCFGAAIFFATMNSPPTAPPSTGPASSTRCC